MIPFLHRGPVGISLHPLHGKNLGLALFFLLPPCGGSSFPEGGEPFPTPAGSFFSQKPLVSLLFDFLLCSGLHPPHTPPFQVPGPVWLKHILSVPRPRHPPRSFNCSTRNCWNFDEKGHFAFSTPQSTPFFSGRFTARALTSTSSRMVSFCDRKFWGTEHLP